MIILASQSSSRRAMLEAAGVAFTSRPAHLDERAIEAGLSGAAPDRVALALAEAKALAVSRGMSTLAQAGQELIARGVTTRAEVTRVIETVGEEDVASLRPEARA